MSSFVYQQVQRWRAGTLTRQAVSFGKENQVELVFAVLGSPTLIRVARQVASKLGAELVTLVWDPPETETRILGFDTVSRADLLREFDAVMGAASRCAVASEGMKTEYELRYKIPCAVLVRATDPKLWQAGNRKLSDQGPFVIAFAGTAYARAEFQALYRALASVGWQLAGRPVVARFLGIKSPPEFSCAGSRAQLEYLGFRSLKETVSVLSEAHVGYLPYWFDPDFSPAVRMCFPDKLSTYISAGCLVFYHGPEDSTPTRFLERYPVGLSCHSHSAAEIIATLRRLATDDTIAQRAQAARQAALTCELNRQVFRRRVAFVLGVEEDELLPWPESSADTALPAALTAVGRA